MTLAMDMIKTSLMSDYTDVSYVTVAVTQTFKWPTSHTGVKSQYNYVTAFIEKGLMSKRRRELGFDMVIEFTKQMDLHMHGTVTFKFKKSEINSYTINKCKLRWKMLTKSFNHIGFWTMTPVTDKAGWEAYITKAVEEVRDIITEPLSIRWTRGISAVGNDNILDHGTLPENNLIYDD